MYRIWQIGVMAAILLIPISAFAGQVTLRNGDRITGKIVRADAKTLVIQSDSAGEITVKWEDIVAIQSEEPLHVGLRAGQVLAGPITTVDGKLQVQTQSEGAVTVSLDAVQFLRNDAEQAAYEAQIERQEHPRLLDLWSGFFDAGLSTTKGNSDTLSFTLDGKAVRESPVDKFTVDFNSILAKNGTTGATVTTAHAITGGIRADFNVSPKFFAFGFTDFQYDEFQDLDLRNVLGGGMGYHVIKSKKTAFEAYGGGAYDQAYYSTGVNQKSGEINLGESVSYKLSGRSSLNEELDLFPNLTYTGQYRMTFNGAAVTKINSWLNWQISFNDLYVSNPQPGIKTNDVILTTGIRVSFGKGQL
jgi:putative salt-induced outer membrane protein YdiY